jgi:hypothetical protein
MYNPRQFSGDSSFKRNVLNRSPEREGRSREAGSKDNNITIVVHDVDGVNNTGTVTHLLRFERKIIYKRSSCKFHTLYNLPFHA